MMEGMRACPVRKLTKRTAVPIIQISWRRTKPWQLTTFSAYGFQTAEWLAR
jgi:hypothetical protein